MKTIEYNQLPSYRDEVLNKYNVVILTRQGWVIILDRDGFKLYEKYGDRKNGWRINYSVFDLHRIEVYDSKNGVSYRVIMFYKELLKLGKGQGIVFLNGDRHDLRQCNMGIKCNRIKDCSFI